MKKRILFLLLILTTAVSGAYSQPKANKLTGLYRYKRHVSYTNAILLSVGGNRFYGDVNPLSYPLLSFFSLPNMSNHMGLHYKQFVNNVLALKTGLTVGGLSGERDNGSGFKSLMMGYDVVLDYHPWRNTPRLDGLYGSIGVGVLMNGFLSERGNIIMDPENDRGFCVVPVIPIAIGYELCVSKHFYMGIELSIKQALIDNGLMDIDNNYDFAKENFMPDGYLAAAITFAYKFNK